MGEERKGGDRIAKVMARAGVASRRDAVRLIVAGRVAVNGTVVTSPALDVTPADRVTLDGKPIDAPQPPRLWLYYKPLGLVTSERDQKGRQTVFESLPEGMPRVMSVGRLDLNSEGLLILTNDGELKRRLELPATGWLRKYRVRVNGMPTDATFDPLRRGIVIDGEDFQPMEITLDRQKGANAWLTVGLREGRNREVRRAMAEVGLTVNRLIRVSYGPFRLNDMKPGDVVEVKARVMREQLGGLLDGLLPGKAEGGERASGRARPDRPRRPRQARERAEGGHGLPAGPRAKGPGGDSKAPARPRPEGARPGRKPHGESGAGGVGDARRPRGKARPAGQGSDAGIHGGPRPGGSAGPRKAAGKPSPAGKAGAHHSRPAGKAGAGRPPRRTGPDGATGGATGPQGSAGKPRRERKTGPRKPQAAGGASPRKPSAKPQGKGRPGARKPSGKPGPDRGTGGKPAGSSRRGPARGRGPSR